MTRRDAFGLLAGGLLTGCAVATRTAAPAPLQRGALAQWCRASEGTIIDADGGVSVWRDLSGQDNHLTQAVPRNRPTIASSAVNGEPALSFDGADQFLDNPYLGEPRCEIIVARLRHGATGLPVFHVLIGADGPAGVQLGAYYFQAMVASSDFDRRLAYVRPTVEEIVSPLDQRDFAVRAESQPVIDAWGIFAVRNDGDTVRLYKSGLRCGQPVAVGAVASQPILRATVGCGFYGNQPTDFAPIDVAEKISFSADLSDAEFLDVIGYLRRRYDLGLSAGSGDFIWPVFQADGGDERGSNDNLVLLQGDGETFRYRPSHYLPARGVCVRDPSMAAWNGMTLLAHTLWSASGSPAAFALAVSRDGLGSFSHLATVQVGAAVADAPHGQCWAPEFVRNRDNSTYLLDGRPVVLCNVSPGPPSGDNEVAGMRYCLFTPSGEDLAAPWTSLGRLPGLPPNIIDGFLLFDAVEQTWFASVTPCNPPQRVRLYRADSMLGAYLPLGGGDALGDVSYEGTSILRLSDGSERYFLDARGGGYFISDNPGGLLSGRWSTPRPVVTPFMPQHGTPLPAPADSATL